MKLQHMEDTLIETLMRMDTNIAQTAVSGKVTSHSLCLSLPLPSHLLAL